MRAAGNVVAKVMSGVASLRPSIWAGTLWFAPPVPPWSAPLVPAPQWKKAFTQVKAFFEFWWRIPDSNRGPADYDSVALTG